MRGAREGGSRGRGAWWGSAGSDRRVRGQGQGGHSQYSGSDEHLTAPYSEEEVEQTFRALDLEKSGKITPQMLKEVTGQLLTLPPIDLALMRFPSPALSPRAFFVCSDAAGGRSGLRDSGCRRLWGVGVRRFQDARRRRDGGTEGGGWRILTRVGAQVLTRFGATVTDEEARGMVRTADTKGEGVIDLVSHACAEVHASALRGLTSGVGWPG